MSTPRDPRARQRFDFSTSARQNPELTQEHYSPEEMVEWEWREYEPVGGVPVVNTPARWPDILKAVKSKDISWDDVVRGMSNDEVGRRCLIVRGKEVRTPGYIPKAFHEACNRENLKRGESVIASAYLPVMQAYKEIAFDKGAKTADRLRALDVLRENYAGKTPEKISVTLERAPWEELMVSGVVNDDQIVQGEVVARSHDYSAREVESSSSPESA